MRKHKRAFAKDPNEFYTEEKPRRKERKSDYQELAEEIMRPAKERAQGRIAKRDPQEYASGAESAFWRLDQEKRDRIRASGKYGSYEEWYAARQARKAARGEGDRAEAPRRAGQSEEAVKMLDKRLRKAASAPRDPKNPYAAFMRPVVIIPDKTDDKPVIADAGTIVRFMDQSALYRDFMSPITHRADEVLVQYGKPDKLKLGWVTNTHPAMVMKPTKGPAFLVTTSSDKGLSAWERMRLMVGRSRKTDPTNWVAPWLVARGQKEPKLLREVTREFGGKPIKGEEFDVRVGRLFSLILKVEELDMASVKSKKSGKKGAGKKGGAKAAKQEKKGDGGRDAEKPAKKDRPAKKGAKKEKRTKASKNLGKSEIITRKYDDHVIRRLSKENPFREGSNRAKLWSKLKKGMTVGEFNKFGEGRARTEIRGYIENGWVKLRRPAKD